MSPEQLIAIGTIIGTLAVLGLIVAWRAERETVE
jgi:hypothetical protein